MSRVTRAVEPWKNRGFIFVYSVYAFVLFVQNGIAVLTTFVRYIYIYIYIYIKHRTLGVIGPPTVPISPFIRVSTAVPFPYHRQTFPISRCI
jgi:hypothetical protein